MNTRILVETTYYQLIEREHILFLMQKERLPRLYSDIYLESCIMNEEYQVKIQTTAYGALDLDEFEEFLRYQKEALEIARQCQQAIENWRVTK